MSKREKVTLGDFIIEEKEPIGDIDGKGLPVLGVTNVEGITVTGVQASADKSKYLHLKPFRFAYNPYRINVGSIGLSSQNQIGIVSPAYVVFRTKEELDPRFLLYFFKSTDGNSQINFYGNRGSVRSALRFDDLAKIQIPLPLLSEQHKIIAQIKSIAEKIKEANEFQKQIASKTEYVIKSLLSKSFDKYSQKYGLKPIGEFLQAASYGTSQYCDYNSTPETTPVLRIPNVAFERIDLSDLKYAVLPQSELGRVLVKENDVLVVRTNGSLDLVGRSAVVPSLDRETAFASYLIRLKCDWGLIMPGYLQMMLKHLRFKGHLIDLARTTAGQYNVSLGRLRTAKIPVPPIEEQKRFMQEINNFQNHIDVLKRYKAEIQKEINAILPSILDKAFKGELG